MRGRLKQVAAGSGVIIFFGFLFFVFLNLNAPVSVTATTYQTPNGPITNITKTCTPIPNTSNNPLANLCLSSTNSANPSTQNSQQTIPVTSNTNSQNVVITGLTITPSNLMVGQGFSINATIKNMGQNTITYSQSVPACGISPLQPSFSGNVQKISLGIACPFTGGGTTLLLSLPPNQQATIVDASGPWRASSIGTTTVTEVFNYVGGSAQATGTFTISPSNTLSLLNQTSTLCPNGGTMVNGQCPTAIVSLPSNTQVNTTIPNPPPPTLEQISIQPAGTLTDNVGNNQTLTGNTIPLQLGEFIAQHGQNVNIDHGKINLQIKLNGKPNTNYAFNGTLWVSINGQQIHPSGIPFATSGSTDASGTNIANLQIPTGVVRSYQLYIPDRATLLTQPQNNVTFWVSNIHAENMNTGKSFSNIAAQKILSLTLDYSQSGIIKQDSNGNSIRGYPDDDTISIQANYVAHPSSTVSCPSRGGICTTFETTTWTSPISAGTATIYLINPDGTQTILGTTPVVQGTVPSATCTQTVYGATGANIISCGSYSNGYAIVNNIPWNSQIKVVISGGSVTPIPITVNTPTSHEDYSYVCTSTCSFTQNP